MIKEKHEIEIMEEAGIVLYDLFEFLEKNIKPGITTEYLNDLAEDYIKDKDCILAFKNYSGFPKSICTSINDEVVHGIPSDYVLKDKDIISIDMGIKYKDYFVDSANTYFVGTISDNDKYLLEHTKESLYEGLNKIKPGVKLEEVCSAIEKCAKKYNLGVIRELVGHGIGKNLHEKPDIPNYYTKGLDLVLKEGMTLAIEPMLTFGKRDIYIKEDNWTIATLDKKNSAHFEHTIVVTSSGYKILTKR